MPLRARLAALAALPLALAPVVPHAGAQRAAAHAAAASTGGLRTAHAPGSPCPPIARRLARAAGPTVRVRSLLPALAAWERAAADLDSAARVAAFRRLVIAAHPEFFGPVFPVPDDAALAGYVAWLGPRVAATRRLAPDIARAVPEAARRVGALFPAFARDTVEVVIGAGFMSNGTVRLVEGRPVLFLGPDVQTIVDSAVADPLVLVAHELTHVAHARANPAVYALVDSAMRRRPSPLGASVYSEGLATWASGCVAPGRPLAVRLLSRGLAHEAPRAAPRLLPVLRRELAATDQPRYGDWFFVGGRPSDVPPRFAYWAGDAIVAELARTHAPDALLRLTPTAVMRETGAALDRLIRRFPDAASIPWRDTVRTADGVPLPVAVVGGARRDTVLVPLGSLIGPALLPLARTHTLVLYDPRARGRSGGVADVRTLGVARDAADLEAVRRHLRLARVRVLGWSYGGLVAARWAFDHPDATAALVLLTPVAPRRAPYVADTPTAPATVPAARDTAAERELRALGTPAADPVRHCRLANRVEAAELIPDPVARARRPDACALPNEWPDSLVRTTVARLDALGAYDWTDAARRFPAPVLVIAGTRDFTPLAAARAWATGPRARLHVVPDAGHYAVVERPDAVLAAIDRFLRTTR